MSDIRKYMTTAANSMQGMEPDPFYKATENDWSAVTNTLSRLQEIGKDLESIAMDGGRTDIKSMSVRMTNDGAVISVTRTTVRYISKRGI
jgi:hypothetical protein